MRLSKTVPSSLRTSIAVLKETRSRSPTLRDRAESLELGKRKRSDRANFFQSFHPFLHHFLYQKNLDTKQLKLDNKGELISSLLNNVTINCNAELLRR